MTATRNHLMRSGDIALVIVFLLLLLFVMILFRIATGGRDEEWAENRRLVQDLGLTDLCLATEARYTRHLSQADWHAPFQDHPMALEHFPSGAIFSPPPHLTAHAPLDR